MPKSVVFLVIFLLLKTSSILADTLLIDDKSGRYLLGSKMMYLEDKKKKYKLDDIHTNKFVQRLFKKSNTQNLNFGFSESVFWIKFTLHNQSQRTDNFWLEFGYPFIDRIELYYKDQDSVWQKSVTGDMFPFETREVKNRLPTFSLFLPPQQTRTYYMRVLSENGGIQLPATLWNPIAFDEYNHDIQFFFGIIYGAIILIILNNVFFYFYIRSLSYLYYSGAMLISLLMIAHLNGHAYEYLWSGSIWLQNNIFPFLITGFCLLISLFARDFLEIPKNLPLINQYIYVVIGALVVLLAFSFFIPYQASVSLSSLFSTGAFVILLWAGYESIRLRISGAILFFLAFSVYVVGLVVYVLKSSAMVSSTFFSEYSVQIGAAFQVLIISIALGGKFRQLQEQQAQVQREANEKLEAKVQERTQALQAQTQELENAYKNVSVLAQIGKDITSALDFNEIFDKLYGYVNQLMDASIFGVDIYHPERQCIEYKLNIENGEKLPSEIVPINDVNNLSVWVITHRAEIFMGDVEKESTQYVENVHYVCGSFPESVIYVPLLVGDKILGLITVQSFQKNAYTQKDLDIIRTLASYSAIALDHASAYDEIASSNRQTLQSIRYAKRIQDAILPSPQIIAQNFEDSFILYKPRDIVSGDFYWFLQRENTRIIAVVDCTGHGVPGAFMTMMGNDLLNQIIVDEKISQPDVILSELDHRVRERMGKGSLLEKDKRNDGMDLAICVITPQMLSFAGAKSPLYFVRNGILEHIKGSVFPIGGTQIKEKIFLKTEIPYQKGDQIYIFSDGYHDQFGGAEGRKFMSRRFRDILQANAHLSMSQQKAILEKALFEWQAKNRQTDDITVLGLKL